MSNGMDTKKEELENVGFAIMHFPTGSVHTTNPKTDFFESWGYYDSSPKVSDDSEVFNVLDMWPSDMILFNSTKQAEEEIQRLLETDEDFLKAGDNRNDFGIFPIKKVIISGYALGEEQ